MPIDGFAALEAAQTDHWYKALKNIITSIEAGKIPDRKDLEKVSPETIGMATAIVNARKALAP